MTTEIQSPPASDKGRPPALSASSGSQNIVKRDRPWHLYPNGTKAVAPNGGHYIRETGGWKWCVGDVFPTPSADADRVILPAND